jgi:ribosomal protein S18 acetylase RimI-like enzyme
MATPADAESVGNIQAALWPEAYAALLPEEALAAFRPEEFTRAWRRSLEDPPTGAYRLLVALAGPEVVGFLAVGPSIDPDASPTDAEILVGGVHPAARRQGHGSRLLNAAVDTLRDQGFSTMRTWLLASDEATQKFLGAAGLILDGARRNRLVGPTERDVAAEVRLAANISG